MRLAVNICIVVLSCLRALSLLSAKGLHPRVTTSFISRIPGTDLEVVLVGLEFTNIVFGFLHSSLELMFTVVERKRFFLTK